MVRRIIIVLVILGLLAKTGTYLAPLRLEKKGCKMTADLLNGHRNEDIVEAMIFIQDVSYDDVMEVFEERYPEECAVYRLSKESEESVTLDEKESELLQIAIEHKRDIYKEFYENQNEDFFNSYKDTAECIFLSGYSPLIIVRTAYTILIEMESDDRTEWITGFYGAEIKDESIESANYFTRADYVRDTCGNRGAGVKIGMIEVGVPDVTDSSFSNATIHVRNNSTNISTHATEVAKIMVGTGTISKGFAPDSVLYCCPSDANSTADFYEGIEWLLTQKVNVINMSMKITASGIYYGVYDPVSKWVDHIAVNHDVHFVKSAGNKDPGNNPNTYVTSPGMAYNALTVGAFNPKGASEWQQYYMFEMYEKSLFTEFGSNRAEKPNLIAVGVGFADGTDIVSGTSYSAPQVTGVIAQLCSYNANLKTKQTVIGAVLMAAAAHKVEAYGSGSVGDTFIDSVRVNGVYQISNKEGAGILDARWARDIVANSNYWSPTVYDNGFPYNRTVYITGATNKIVRVCIFWLRQNSVSSPHAGGNTTVASMSNLNLRVLNPNGIEVAASTTTQGNFEIVQFMPLVTGNYTIQIQDLGGHTGKDYIGIALWTGTVGN